MSCTLCRRAGSDSSVCAFEPPRADLRQAVFSPRNLRDGTLHALLTASICRYGVSDSLCVAVLPQPSKSREVRLLWKSDGTWPPTSFCNARVVTYSAEGEITLGPLTLAIAEEILESRRSAA